MKSASASQVDRRHALLRSSRFLLFISLPLLVWFLGSFYFAGDLGKWLDDYATTVRDPATGSFEWSKLLRYQWWFFWRPIHLQLIFTLQTLLWNHVWAIHLFSALMHAIASLGLWRFLRICGVAAPVSASAALLMLGSVQGFEAIHWPATVSTSIAAAAFFWAAILTIRHARREAGPGAVVLLGILGFVIPCLYEQPAAALCALPILYLGSCRQAAQPDPAQLSRSTFQRMIRALAPCAIGVVIYAALFIVTVRRDPMTRESHFIHPDEFWAHITYNTRAMGVMLDPVRGLGELWSVGWNVLRGSALGLIGWVLLGACATLAWVAMSITPRSASVDPTPSDPNSKPLPAPILIAFAAAAFLLALLPITAIRGAGPTPRLSYFPLACVLIVGAAAINWILQVPRSRPTWRTAALALVAGASALGALAGSVNLIGVQQHMRWRYERDMAEMAALHTALPNPTPETIFIPLHVDPDPRTPKSDRLRNSFQPIWASPWAVHTQIKHEFRRADAHSSALYINNQSNAIFRLGEPTTISWSHYSWHLPQPRVENSFPSFALAKIVPFTIDSSGAVTLVPSLRVHSVGGHDVHTAFPQVRSGLPAAIGPELQLPMFLETGRPWLSTWRWPHRQDAQVGVKRIESWGIAQAAARMHPATPQFPIYDGDSDEMTLALAPSSAPRRFLFHATFDEQSIAESVLGDGVELIWSLDDAGPGAPAAILHRVPLLPSVIRSTHSWQPIDLLVPPTDRPRTLRLTVGPGPQNNPNYDRVIISCGEDASASLAAPPASPTPRKD